MQNIRLVVEYNGSYFHGWQAQPNLKTVYSDLRRAISIVTKKDISNIIASGRTDAGVHARGQVVNFHIDDLGMELKTFSYAISSILRHELSIVHIDIADEKFHSTRDSIKKQYSYFILNRGNPPCIDFGKVWHIAKELDVEKMKSELKYLIGIKDFSSFRASGCTAKSPIKEIFDISLEKTSDIIKISIIGSGFLKQMVRNIVGTLVAIGKGEKNSIEEILLKKDRRFAGKTAPPYGLYLDWVKYPDFNSKDYIYFI